MIAMDENLITQIHQLVEEEHHLEAKASPGQPLSGYAISKCASISVGTCCASAEPAARQASIRASAESVLQKSSRAISSNRPRASLGRTTHEG